MTSIEKGHKARKTIEFNDNSTIHYRNYCSLCKGRWGGTPLCDVNEDVRPDRVWFSGCFVLN